MVFKRITHSAAILIARANTEKLSNDINSACSSAYWPCVEADTTTLIVYCRCTATGLFMSPGPGEAALQPPAWSASLISQDKDRSDAVAGIGSVC